jgi:hypothetical protein
MKHWLEPTRFIDQSARAFTGEPRSDLLLYAALDLHYPPRAAEVG